MNNTPLNRYMHLLSYIILLCSVLYISFVGYRHWREVINIIPTAKAWSGLGISAFIYSVLCVILPLNWCKLVYALGGNVTFKDSFRIYGRSQIAKYLPGNIFHYVGRQLLGHDLGLSHGLLAASTFLEGVLLIGAAGILAIFAVTSFGWQQGLFFGAVNNKVIYCIGVLFLLGCYPLFSIARRRSEWLANFIKIKLLSIFYIILFIFLVYILFLITNGAILGFLTIYFWQDNTISIFIFIGAYAISWVAGFVTPGAPGGIGIREAILVSTLSLFLQEANALTLAIAFRIVTILGDFIFLLATYIFSVSWKRSAANK